MAINRINEARLRLIQKRQLQDAWGKDYIAAIWATPGEAPSISTPSILHPAKLGGRPMHTLSRPETWTALLALYHPKVWDVHEQRMLFPGPRPHFLDGHARTVGQTFQPFRGTLAVAQEMGRLSKHPKCRVGEIGSQVWAPFPYIGDLLLFTQDDVGPYVINWSVKDKEEDFRRRGPQSGKPRLDDDDPSALHRHALESTYYRDAGIPTRQVAGRNVDSTLRANLRRLFLSSAETVPLSPVVCSKLWLHFAQSVGCSTPAFKLIREAAQHLSVDVDVIKLVLEHGVWNRQIRVDLFAPVLLDRPLKPQRADPLDVYVDWFSRGTL